MITTWMRWVLAAALLLSVSAIGAEQAKPNAESGAVAAAPAKKKIVLIAGKKSHGPVGNGQHDYGWSVQLLRAVLQSSNVADRVTVEAHLDGWPADEKSVADADTIMVISDGRDGKAFAEALHIETAERIALVDRLTKRGCGLVTFHFSTFAPQAAAENVLDWTGGYFQWETDGQKKWYSAIKHIKTDVKLASPEHPISRGVSPSFAFGDEFYYRIRFREKDARLTPILLVPALGGTPIEHTVAWAVQRADGGRGFATTAGHNFAGWQDDNFRKLILNGLVWSAGVEVPTDGVESRQLGREEIRVLVGAPPGDPGPKSDVNPDGQPQPKPAAKPEPKPELKSQPRADAGSLRVLMLAGNDAHKWHNWERTSPAIQAVLERDPRIAVEVVTAFDELAKRDLSGVSVIVLNSYCNWHDPRPPSDAAKEAFLNFLARGGGLVVVHFANGAFHFSLPKAGESDWPEYRKIVRRVWDHKAASGHDAFGRFTVRPTAARHPITDGLAEFELADELYFRQVGDEPIEPLITAKSRVTGQDEPLAWAYTVGRARVFQTLLGHSEKTYEAFAAREMLRRAVAWTASVELRSLTPEQDAGPALKPTPATPQLGVTLTEGRFGRALDARAGGVLVDARPEYRTAPLTVEARVRILGKGGFNIIVACEPKSSAQHWELFTFAGTGRLTVYLPGASPDHVRSTADIADGQWHRVAVILEADRVRLFLDGKAVADQAVKFTERQPVEGPLGIGRLAEGGIGCDGLIDEVRVTRGVHEPTAADSGALTTDEHTLGLWSFDALTADVFPDAGSLRNPARPMGKAPAAKPTPSAPPAGPNLKPADARLSAVLLDRSTEDALMAVRADGNGRLFVGGREAVFTYDPDPKSSTGYGPRRELIRFHPDAIIIGLELRGDDLYVLTSSALYLVEGGRSQRENLKPRRLLWGLPLDLHVSFHCLAWGPEGDLYLTHGDPLLNYGDWSRPDHWGHWILYTVDGKAVPFTGAGAVLRLRPDGTGLRVVAGGLRGPVGLCFDADWNLFTNDNDHESRADQYAPCRLMHVVAGADFAWPRGWLADKSPDRWDLLELMQSDLGRGVPCDQVIYDEPLLPELRGQLLLARWDRFAVTAHKLTPRGSSFASRDAVFAQGASLARPTGLAVGRGGRVFVTTHYLGGNVVSPHCVSDLYMLSRADDPVGHPFEPVDVVAAEPEALWQSLSSPSWERRRRAHAELLRRGGAVLVEAVRRLESVRDDDPAARHLPWLAAASRRPEALRLLAARAAHADAAVRRLAVRALVEFAPAGSDAEPRIAAALSDADPATRLAALARFLDGSEPLSPEIADAVARCAAEPDSYLRQIAATVLARRAARDQLAAQLSSEQPTVRLAGVLAAGFRLTVPAPHEAPPAALPLSYPKGNGWFHDKVRYADEAAPVELDKLARIGSYTTAQRWAAIPPSDAAKAALQLLERALDDRDERVRLQAAHFLFLLRDARLDPKIAAVRRAVVESRLTGAEPRAVGKVWLLGPLPDGARPLAKVHEPERGPIDLTTEHAGVAGQLAWREGQVRDSAVDVGPAVGQSASHYVYFRLQSRTRQSAALTLDSSDGLRLWLNGRLVWQRELGRSGAETLFVELQPGGNDVLLRVGRAASAAGPLSLSLRSREPLSAELPERAGSATLAERLRAGAGAGTDVPPEFLSVDWGKAVTLGDAAAGRRIFGQLGCSKCHAISAEQKVPGAPSLTDARRRFTAAHIVESVLLPSKQIAPEFRASMFVLADETVIVGLVVSESDEALELLLPDTKRRTLAKSEIAERKVAPQSAMPAGLVKTPTELRDLLAYILSESPTPP